MNLFRKILHSVFLTMNFVVLIVLVFCGNAYRIRPEHTSLTSFLGYAFPLVALVNLFFLLYWTVRLRIWALVSLVGLLLTWDSYRAWFPINLAEKSDRSETAEKSLKVLSFNVMFFAYNREPFNGDCHSIVKYILDLDPDVVCLQEAGPDFIRNGRFQSDVRKQLARYKYILSGEDENRFSVVLLSKYKVIRHERISYESKSNSSYYYDLLVHEDTVRIINNHLESNKLNLAEKNKYTDLIRKRESSQITEVAEVLSSKVGNATVIRSRQADVVSGFVRESPFPVLVCGDFNDMPGSYTYRKIRGDLKDTWIEKGSGWGNTFRENLFLFRIDYILHSPEWVCTEMKRDKVKLSDHYPIWANFKLQ